MTARLAIAAGAALALLLLAGCCCAPRSSAPERSAAAGETLGETLYVIRRGWHIEIGFPFVDLRAGLAPVAASLPAARFVALGFGDRHYLESRHKEFPNLLAALWPGPGLILATGLGVSPESAFGAANVIALPLDEQQARAVRVFVSRSLARHDGTVRVEAPGPYAGSLYFAATQRYSAVYTCNTWVAEALRAAGLPVRSAGVVFAWQVWVQAKRIAGTTAAAPPATSVDPSGQPQAASPDQGAS